MRDLLPSWNDDAAPTGVSRYDLLLAILPIPLLVGAFVGVFTALSTTLSVALGSFPATMLIGYGLFYDDPAGSV